MFISRPSRSHEEWNLRMMQMLQAIVEESVSRYRNYEDLSQRIAYRTKLISET